MYPYGYTLFSRSIDGPPTRRPLRGMSSAGSCCLRDLDPRELSHPLMGLLCRADDHPRQPPPHAACCAGRDRLAAGVRCAWRSRLGVVSCLTRPSSEVQWPVPPGHPPQRKVWRCSQGTHPRSARSGGDPPSADACLQPFSTHWLIFSHVHIHPKGDSLCRVGEG